MHRLTLTSQNGHAKDLSPIDTGDWQAALEREADKRCGSDAWHWDGEGDAVVWLDGNVLRVVEG